MKSGGSSECASCLCQCGVGREVSRFAQGWEVERRLVTAWGQDPSSRLAVGVTLLLPAGKYVQEDFWTSSCGSVTYPFEFSYDFRSVGCIRDNKAGNKCEIVFIVCSSEDRASEKVAMPACMLHPKAFSGQGSKMLGLPQLQPLNFVHPVFFLVRSLVKAILEYHI